jgi:hypothetical protein
MARAQNLAAAVALAFEFVRGASHKAPQFLDCGIEPKRGDARTSKLGDQQIFGIDGLIGRMAAGMAHGAHSLS